MRHTQPRYLTTMAFVLMLLAAFLIGYQWNGSTVGRPVWAAVAMPGPITSTLDTTLTLRPVERFREAMDRLLSEYVDPIKDPDPLVYSAIRGMLTPLKDPYTRFMDPKEFKDFNTDNAGSFAGIGATLSMIEIPELKVNDGEGTMAPVTCPVCGSQISDVKHYRVAILEPMPNTPAKAAGLQSGDFIIKVDGVSTDGMLVSDAADKIRGPKGTNVTLTLSRKGVEKPFEVTITRDKIDVPATEEKMLDGNIAYLRLFSFNEKTYGETRAALQDFKRQKARGLVLDLRNNPGGLLRECIRIASMMLNSDEKLIVSTKGRRGLLEAFNRTESQVWDQPIVVLVNKGSASASEILSGALKDYKRAPIVGESTFGKALVQTVIPLSDGSAMAVTTAHYYTPNGNDVGKKGVAPDVTVELDKETKLMNEKDNQAQKALAILKDEMARAK